MEDVGFILQDKVDNGNQVAKENAAMTSSIFKFPVTTLEKLKILSGTETKRVTTHDALTALLYGAVCYARSLRFSQRSNGACTVPSTMGIAVNGRNRIDPSMQDYTGNLTLYAAFSNPLSLPTSEIPPSLMTDTNELATRLNLPHLASQTHNAVAAVSFDYIMSTISLASALPDVSVLQPSFSSFYQGMDFFISSGAGFPVFDDEWWPGGFVEASRIPLKAHWDGSCGVLATKDRSAGLDVLLGLREDDMKVVKGILYAFGAYIA